MWRAPMGAQPPPTRPPHCPCRCSDADGWLKVSLHYTGKAALKAITTSKDLRLGSPHTSFTGEQGAPAPATMKKDSPSGSSSGSSDKLPAVVPNAVVFKSASPFFLSTARRVPLLSPARPPGTAAV